MLYCTYLFIIYRKSKEELEADAAAYKKIAGNAELTKNNKPSKFKFIFQGNQKDLTGLPDDYPYNWYLGGRIFIAFELFELYFADHVMVKTN